MQKVLIYSPDVWTLESTKSCLEVQFSNPISGALDEASMKVELEKNVFHLGIFRIKEIEQKTLQRISQMRSMGYKFPIIIASDVVTAKFIDVLTKMQDVHILSTPYRDVSLLGLTRKLFISREVPRQYFRRYYTNQIAEIESLGTGDSLLSCMYNLSQGGAYCEFDKEKNVVVGDLMRIKVDREDLNSQHVLNAKVVWVTEKGKFSGRFGCGLRFISQKEVYQSLMSKL